MGVLYIFKIKSNTRHEIEIQEFFALGTIFGFPYSALAKQSKRHINASIQTTQWYLR